MLQIVKTWHVPLLACKVASLHQYIPLLSKPLQLGPLIHWPASALNWPCTWKGLSRAAGEGFLRHFPTSSYFLGLSSVDSLLLPVIQRASQLFQCWCDSVSCLVFHCTLRLFLERVSHVSAWYTSPRRTGHSRWWTTPKNCVLILFSLDAHCAGSF